MVQIIDYHREPDARFRKTLLFIDNENSLIRENIETISRDYKLLHNYDWKTFQSKREILPDECRKLKLVIERLMIFENAINRILTYDLCCNDKFSNFLLQSIGLLLKNFEDVRFFIRTIDVRANHETFFIDGNNLNIIIEKLRRESKTIIFDNGLKFMAISNLQEIANNIKFCAYKDMVLPYNYSDLLLLINTILENY